MPSIARIYDFQSGTTIQSGQVDEELNQLVETVNELPDADGSVQDDLNADLLDGFHASETGGNDTIPVCNGDMQVALNAEFLGGLAAADFADAGFPAGTKIPFYQAAAPAGWTAVSRPSVDRVLGWGSSAAGGAANAQTSWGNLTAYFAPVIDSHVLTTAEIPAHTHTFGSPTLGAVASGAGAFGVTAMPSVPTGSAGGGGGHSHTGSLDSGASSATLYRPPISWIIIASKD